MQLLWEYYKLLKAYQQTPRAEDKAQPKNDFDQLFGRCFSHHASLNNVLLQFGTHEAKLL